MAAVIVLCAALGAQHMKMTMLGAAALALSAIVLPASAADDAGLTRMALCQDSWVEWTKSEPKKFEAYREHFMGQFSHHDNEPHWVPKAGVSVLGLQVAQAFPDSVGMGVGFSLTVDTPFDKARAAMEKALGKKLGHCEASDGMKDCELEIAPQRTVTLMAEDNPKSRQTLIGCYYFYEK
jgi:hypothetical protein